MKTISAIALTAAICLPLGAFAKDKLAGHPNLEKARASLDEADKFITESQKANEWGGDEGGHGKKAKEAISLAKDELRQAADFLNKKK